MASIHTEKGVAPDHIIKTPIWMLVIRVFQFLLALIIVGLAGTLIHQAYLDEEGLALAIGLFTWIIVAYVVLTEKLGALNKGYNIIAILALDAFMVILWLATFAATAAKRALFVVDVNVNSCIDNGELTNSRICSRSISKRGVILFESGKAMLSAIAGLGALVWLLFIATFVWTLITFLRARKEGRFQSLFGESNHSAEGNYQMEAKAQSEGFIAQPPQQPQQPIQPQHTGQYPAGSYPAQGQYPQAQYPQADYSQTGYPQQGTVSPPSMSPVPQQPPYQPPQELYSQQSPPPQGQQYAPPQQPYYPQQPQQHQK